MIKFIDHAHLDFFNQMVDKTDTQDDPYRKALFYVLGLTDTTRRHIDEIYDFAGHCPHFNIMRKGWQTSTSVKVTRLAFSLYNGYDGSGKTDQHSGYAPYELFACGLMEFMFEALRVRYPEYTAAGQDRARRYTSMLEKI